MNTPKPDRKVLTVIGADANTLNDVDCDFPVPGLSAIVGVSGSGKSSLLGDTVAAELGRRNALLHGLPGFDRHPHAVRAFVGAAPPALLVGQRPFRSSSRTTVATATGAMADLRALFQSVGHPLTMNGEAVPTPGPDTLAAWACRHARGMAVVWAIPLRWEMGDGAKAVQRLREHGITQAVLRGENDSAKLHETGRPVDLTNWKPLRPRVRHSLEAEVGRLRLGTGRQEADLRGLIAKAWAIAGHDVIVELPDTDGHLTLGGFGPQLDGRRDWVHPDWPMVFHAPDPHILSFNAPEHAESGACPRCRGLGRTTEVDESALILHPARCLMDGAFSLWSSGAYKHVNIQHDTIAGLAGRCGFHPETPWNRLLPEAQAMILDGTGDELIQGIDPKTGRKAGAPRRFEGFRPAILRRWAGSETAKARLGALVREGACPDCDGSRWSAAARALHALGIPLADWLSMPMEVLTDVTERRLCEASDIPSIAHHALERLGRRARTLTRLGLAHLSGDRGMLAVSDGEARRLQIGAVLAQPSDRLTLLLDEPARGLHETDLDPMIAVLRELSIHHGVLLNEHRTRVVAAADHVVELGPGPGAAGGRIQPHDRMDPTPPRIHATLPDIHSRRFLEIDGASVHTVRDQNVRLPLGAITAIVGVSGSGKSSFMRGVLVPALLSERAAADAELDGEDRLTGRWTAIRGVDGIARVHVLHQRVPPRNRRSLVATLTRALDPIATAYADTDLAKNAGLGREDFRLNGGAGRCPDCKGTGEAGEDEAGAPCPTCGGRRYGAAALGATIAGFDIAQTLEHAVALLPALWRKAGAHALADMLEPLFAAMADLGVGHLALGRRIDSLSGGEVQRLRVALTLAGGDQTEGHLFILDEPAAGLHRDDTERLVAVLRRMVDGGRNTVIVIEHNLHLVAAADWLVEFGPGAGAAGGQVIASDPPTDVVLRKNTPTAHALAPNPPSPPKSEPQSPSAAEDQGRSRPAAWLNTMLAGELDTGSTDISDTASDPLARLLPASRRLWEIADLNLEIAKLLLDLHRDAAARAEDRLLDAWETAPDSRLAINPLVPEMRVWGADLPRTAIDAATTRLRRLGMAGANSVGTVGEERNPGRTRVQFPPLSGDRVTHRAALDHALAVGGGFVELVGADGRVLETVERRPLDLMRGLVAPGRTEPLHLSRLRPEGACPACAGHGLVTATDPALLLAGSSTPSLDVESILTPPAAALFKGIWRADARPFLRRLAEEGLDTPDARDRRLLHGYWCRPGHGSFLKPKADPEEVGSWLSWDGLYRRLWAELPRSRDTRWRAAVEQARRDIPCLECGGTGHGPAIRLLSLDGRTLADWMENGTMVELRSALVALPVNRPRQALTRDRVVRCLEPLALAQPPRSLAAPVNPDDPACRAAAGLILAEFAMAEGIPVETAS